MIDDTGATSVSRDGRVFKVYAEVVGNDFKRGPTGQIVNHAFDCPNRKKFNQKALDQKHEQVQAGTYAPTYSASNTGTGTDASTSTSISTLKFSPEAKSQREEIKEMAEEKNKIARKDIEAKLEIAKALLAVAQAIRYHADTAGGLGDDRDANLGDNDLEGSV